MENEKIEKRIYDLEKQREWDIGHMNSVLNSYNEKISDIKEDVEEICKYILIKEKQKSEEMDKNGVNKLNIQDSLEFLSLIPIPKK